jgi:hypothetical protein
VSSSPYSNSYPNQQHHLKPIPEPTTQPIPENYQYSPQPQGAVLSSSPNQRRRSSSYGYDPRQSYESAHSYQSAHSHHSRHGQNGYGNYDDRYNYGNENEGAAPTGYGDWSKEEVSKYEKNQAMERRPTLGGSLMSLVKKGGEMLSSDRR